jgi:hypothetical protein
VVGFFGPNLEWELTEMPGDVASPRKAEIVYVVLLAIIRYTHSDRHGLINAPQFHGYSHQTLAMTGRHQGPKLKACSFHNYRHVRLCDAQRMPALENRSVNLNFIFSVRRVLDALPSTLIFLGSKNPRKFGSVS